MKRAKATQPPPPKWDFPDVEHCQDYSGENPIYVRGCYACHVRMVSWFPAVARKRYYTDLAKRKGREFVLALLEDVKTVLVERGPPKPRPLVMTASVKDGLAMARAALKRG